MTEYDPENPESWKKVYKPYLLVWLALLVLTGITVLCSSLRLGRLGIWTALTIASIKGALVAFFFMHLREEESLFKFFFLIAIIILAIFIGLTLFDAPYR